MISMVDKIAKNHIKSCIEQQEHMIQILQKNQQAFLNAPELLDFEREWMDYYVGGSE